MAMAGGGIIKGQQGSYGIGYGQRAPAPPAGYTTEPNTGRLIPIVGSGQDALVQRTRQQQIEDDARQRNLAWTTEDRFARDTLRQKLIGMLDRPTETDSGGGFDFNAFMRQAGAGGGGGGAGVPASIGTVAPPDTSAAQANLFARAKDKIGLQTQGSLASLRSALAGRGMLGGGAEARGVSNVLTAGQGQLADTTREQAIQEGNRLTDFAKMGYEGAISQRGQDITARGQDLQAQEAARDAALRAAQTAYEGRQANTRTRYDSVNQLLGRLY